MNSADMLILQMHDVAMRGDAEEACYGRIAKCVLPAFLDAIAAEVERGSSLEHMLISVTRVLSVQTTAAAGYLAPRPIRSELLRMLLKAINDMSISLAEGPGHKIFEARR